MAKGGGEENEIKISIIVPTLRSHRPKNYEKRLYNTLHACLRQSFTSEEFEILLVGNLPDRALADWIVSHFGRRISYLVSGAVGVNRARNLGVQRARGRVLLFLDDDCVIINKNYLKKLWQLFIDSPAVGAMGGSYLNPADGSSWVVRAYHRMTELWIGASQASSPFHGGGFLCANLLGGNSAYRHEIFTQGHRFNENIFWGGDETEFQRRLVQLGWRMAWHPDLSLEHRASDRVWSYIRQAWRHGRASHQYQLVSYSSQVTTFSRVFRLSGKNKIFTEPRNLLFLLFHWLLVQGGRTVGRFAMGFGLRQKLLRAHMPNGLPRKVPPGAADSLEIPASVGTAIS